jgi:hypothetical protein
MIKRKAGSQTGNVTLTTKSWESTRFTCVQAMCDILLEKSQWGLQLCLKLHRNQRSTWKVMGSQNRGSPNGGSFEIKNHLDVASIERCKIYYKGEGGGFPQVRAVVNLVSSSCMWLVLAPKVLQLCTNHFVLVLCRSVWMIEAYQFFLVPSRSSSMPLYNSKVLQTREHAPTSYSFVVFNLRFTFESFKELGTHHSYKYTIHGKKGGIVQRCYVTIVKEVLELQKYLNKWNKKGCLLDLKIVNAFIDCSLWHVHSRNTYIFPFTKRFMWTN